MKTKELFDKKNIELFMPDGVEYIYTILQGIGYSNNNFKSRKGRQEALEIIQKLFELELIEVFRWGEHHNKLKDKDISNEEIMKHIKEVWFIGADFEDFISMPMFKYKDWYLNALEKGGENFSLWIDFFNEIGDLEKWIEENRPKK